MIVVGIDPGTSCGVAAVSDDEVAWTTVVLPSWRHHAGGLGDGHDQCCDVLAEAITDVVHLVRHPGIQPLRSAIEDSQHAASVRAAAVQAEHLTMAALVLSTSFDAHPIPVNPATWQHGLVGGLGRDEYVRYAAELTGGELNPRHHDAAAAICIAEWAWHHVVRRSE